MREKLDPFQNGNHKKSIQDYLIKIMDYTVTNVDRNSQGEISAFLATFVDWKKAYSIQDHILGIQSFIKSGI